MENVMQIEMVTIQFTSIVDAIMDFVRHTVHLSR